MSSIEDGAVAAVARLAESCAGILQSSLVSAIHSSVSARLGTIKKREPSVFLSHARADTAVIQEIADRLQAAGIRVWLDRMLAGGENWMQQIERELPRLTSSRFSFRPTLLGASGRSKSCRSRCIGRFRAKAARSFFRCS